MWTSRQFLIAVGMVIVCSQMVLGQDLQVGRTNKTVEVTVTETVQVEPEIAVLHVGYQNYGPTKDRAFEENLRLAKAIVDELQKSIAGKQDIETEELRLNRVEPNEKWSQEERSARQFGAEQSWNIRVPVERAQGALDLAIRAGANDIEDVDWEVRDPEALSIKATGAALAKARTLANQMATELGSKLGELLYASNSARRPKNWPFASDLQTSASTIAGKEIPLRLFPKKVEQQATVHAIFAIE